MSRQAPCMPPPKLDSLSDDERGMITQVRKYKLITPLFGGGVEPAEADPVTVIRGSSIRGHLRFWWRATRGGQFNGDLKQMKEAEDQLWGKVSSQKEKSVLSPETVKIYVEVINKGKPLNQVKARNTRNNRQVRISAPNSPYGYVAFPLQDKPRSSVLEGVSFNLHLEFPLAYKQEVEAALWAWETFGGIGARTRRGFGAIHCIAVSKDTKDIVELPYPHSDQVEANILKLLQEHVVDGVWPPVVPHLSRTRDSFKVVQGNGNELQAWQTLINALRNFRQDRDGRNGFGKSKWPEANEIRRRAGLPPNLADPQTTDDLVQKFPRAVFGLPIIFHMPHDPSLKDLTLTLQGEDGIQRLASPLILKPLACAGGKAVGLAAILNTPKLPPKGLMLDGLPTGRSWPSANLTETEAQKIDPLNGDPDVLRAFLNTL